ncbi:MAG: DUF4974 domain-containing protein [Marinifilaceae bacterium]|nr:DUF4974 domain-containing protein [Marinifilaceae bacterium]
MEEEKQHKEKFSGESMQEKAGQRQEWTDEQIERLLEAIHQAARMDREMMAERLERRLAALRRARRMRRIRWMAGSVAAAIIVLMLVWRPWMEVKPERVMPVAQVSLPEITVPTVIATGTADEILEIDTLVTGTGTSVYEVKKEQSKEEQVLPREVKYNRVVIPRGYTYRVALADGSVVTLNAGSELKFPVEFRDSAREVEFKGEGYFEVAKGEKPFVVKAGDTRVRVYGTRFNLLYSEQLALSEAVLLEGSIGMRVQGVEKKIVPNERVYCVVGDSTLQVEKVNAEEYISWLGTSFKYCGVRLDKIMNDFANWYGVEIQVAPELKNQTYTLEFDKTCSIQEVLQMMKLITGKTIKEEGGAYTIY